MLIFPVSPSFQPLTSSLSLPEALPHPWVPQIAEQKHPVRTWLAVPGIRGAPGAAVAASGGGESASLLGSTAEGKPPGGSVGNIMEGQSLGPYPASVHSETLPGPCLPPTPTLCPHTLGLCDLCPSLEKQLLVFPGHKCGSLQLVVSHPVGKGRWVGGWPLSPCGCLAPASHSTPSSNGSFHCRIWQAQNLALHLLRLRSMHIRAMWPVCP